MNSFLLRGILLCICLNACKSKTTKDNDEQSKTESQIQEIQNNISESKIEQKSVVVDTYKTALRPGEEVQLRKTYSDTVNFISYDDNYDYWYFLAEKNKDTVEIIYADESISQLVKGDKIIIDWEIKRLEEAGDPEIFYIKPYLSSFKKEFSETSDKKSFVISCGSGCAMTYSEDKIVTANDTKEVTFKVAMYVNERLSDQYLVTYQFNCETSAGESIKLKGSNEDSTEQEHPEIKKRLNTYLRQLCN